MKVLIVDDNSMMRDVLRMFLEQFKHEVVGEAEDGKSALKAFTELRPELVLLDLVMPGTKGLEVLDGIRTIDPAARIIIVSAVDQPEITRQVLEHGAAAILQKPISSDELVEAMKLLK